MGSAPTASFQAYVFGLQQGQEVYLTGRYTGHGIASLNMAGGTSPITVTIQFKPPSTLGAGTYTDTIQMEACYDQACTQQATNSPQSISVQYTVTDNSPHLTSINPSSAVAGGAAFTLSVTGSNFTPSMQILWNGSSRPTTYVSSTQLSAQIATADIAAPGDVPVSVALGANGPASNALNFTIQPGTLTLSSISPSEVASGGSGFTLTVLGTGFTSTSTVMWNGSARPTTYVSVGEITAHISASDIAATGTVAITVQDPSTVVGTTPPLTLTISKPSVDAVAFQISPAHTGQVDFASVSLPTSAAWTADVGGTPSYSLIANGMVFVTVQLSTSNGGSGGSAVLALDQATGRTVWGPVMISGKANAAYDAGKVFVISSPFANAATMEAFDASTGNQLWSTLLSGQYMFTAAPTAANGLVFTGGAGGGGTLYALDERTGAVVWTQSVQNGDNSTPAVTADGVYVTYPCQTYDFRPATGEPLWNDNTGCEGGGGATPVVANQLVYSPNEPAGYDGDIYNAESGATAGTYTADSPPAFTGTMGFFLQGGTLRGITLSNNTIQWSFDGDGQLVGSPIVVNQYVFIGSSSGNLYALDSTSGQKAWEVTLPAPIDAGVYTLQFSGLSAGDGLLIVPSGTKVTAYVLSTNP